MNSCILTKEKILEQLKKIISTDYFIRKERKFYVISNTENIAKLKILKYEITV